MKKVLGLFLLLVLIITGCSSTSKLDEVIGEAKDDKEAFQLVLDYSNKNITYHKLESEIKYTEDSTSHIVSDVWCQEGKVYYHRTTYSDMVYEETLLGTSKRASVFAADFGEGTVQKANYKELTADELPSSNQIFKTEYDNMEVKKETQDDCIVFTVRTSSTSTNEETNDTIIYYYNYEFTVNSDCFITKVHMTQTDKDGKKVGIESTELFTDINKDVTFDENTIDSQMKALEGKSLDELKENLNK